MGERTAQEMDALLARLFPICRSITGDGLRETLTILKELIPLEVKSVPSGTAVFDWTVPREWHVRDAYIADESGARVVDFKASNLHLVSYSAPVDATMTLAELRPHLHSAQEFPDRIPYRTSYYKEEWGFCLRDRDLQKLTEGTYKVVIDTSLEDGVLNYGELLIPGRTTDEILLTTYICHPSLANDNLSGPILLAYLGARLLTQTDRQYSYRLVFAPETIGALTWLAKNETTLARIRHGLVVTCVGDPGDFTYKKTRDGNRTIDRAVTRVLKEDGRTHHVLDFYPSGSDERQYCSPQFDLPVGSLMRTPYARYPEYHTSADDLSFVRGAQIDETLALYEKVVELLEREREETFVRTDGRGEPMLGKRDLYPSIGGPAHDGVKDAMMWVLNFSDGSYSLPDIAARANLPLENVRAAAQKLVEHGLIRSI